MNLESFTDELLSLRAGESLVKTAMTMAEAKDYIRRSENNEFEGVHETDYHLKKGWLAHEIVTGHRKAASKSRLFERFGAIGAAAGLGSLGLGHAKAMATENPWDTPRETAPQAAIQGALGGLTAAGLIKLLGIMASKGKRR